MGDSGGKIDFRLFSPHVIGFCPMCVKFDFTSPYLQDMSMSMLMAGMALMAPQSRVASENIVS